MHLKLIKLKIINFLIFFLTFNVLTSYYPTLISMSTVIHLYRDENSIRTS